MRRQPLASSQVLAGATSRKPTRRAHLRSVSRKRPHERRTPQPRHVVTHTQRGHPTFPTQHRPFQTAPECIDQAAPGRRRSLATPSELGDVRLPRMSFGQPGSRHRRTARAGSVFQGPSTGARSLASRAPVGGRWKRGAGSPRPRTHSRRGPSAARDVLSRPACSPSRACCGRTRRTRGPSGRRVEACGDTWRCGARPPAG